MISSDRDEGLMLSASSTEELDFGRHEVRVLSKQLSQSISFEELVKVVTCAVAKFNLEWLNEEQEIICSYACRFLSH